jgi:predicted RNA-binding protein YlqC (UPF0109 family)
VTKTTSLQRSVALKHLVEEIAKALVDYPENVCASIDEGSHVVVLELRTHPHDLGKVIGGKGRNAKAIRTLLSAAGVKINKRFTLEIVEGENAAAIGTI